MGGVKGCGKMGVVGGSADAVKICIFVINDSILNKRIKVTFEPFVNKWKIILRMPGDMKIYFRVGSG